LQSINAARQAASREIYEQALAQIGEVGERKLLTAVGEDWPVGLVGLVAGKLANKFYRPAYVITRVNGTYVGSGRGIEGFNVTEALRASAANLDRFGGHPQACGFSTTGAERLAVLLSDLHATAEQGLTTEQLTPRLAIEAEMDPAEADGEFFTMLRQLAPFGTGNPEPVFLARDLTVVSYDLVGSEGRHLRLTVRTVHGKIVKMIGFGLGETASRLELGKPIDVAYEISENVWNGERSLQFKMIDWQNIFTL